jgi:hypothetical protein
LKTQLRGRLEFEEFHGKDRSTINEIGISFIVLLMLERFCELRFIAMGICGGHRPPLQQLNKR